jgi:hypothetical protein
MLVYNEVKVYAPRETDADFAMIKENYDARVYDALGTAMPEGSKMVPRVFKTNIGDIFTTNCVMEDGIELGAKLTPNTNGILAVDEGATEFVWEVVKVYTLGDNQKAVKLMRIA